MTNPTSILNSVSWLPRGRVASRLTLGAVDVALVVIAISMAFPLALARQDAAFTAETFAAALGIALASKLPVLSLSGIYRVDWRRLDTHDAMRLARTVTAAGAMFAVVVLILRMTSLGPVIPLRILPVDYLLTLTAIGGFRVVMRLGREARASGLVAPGKDVLVFGAGDAGHQVVRAMRDEVDGKYTPVGFVDDSPAKQGLSASGVPVLGSREDLERLARSLGFPELWIAMPSAPGNEIRDVASRARAAGFDQIKTVPGLRALMTGQVGLNDVREIQLEELLGRDPLQIDAERVADLVRGRRLLVTGAAGSIGSELCRQLSRFEPSLLVALDQDETGIFNLMASLSDDNPSLQSTPVVGDIRDRTKVGEVFASYRPEVVFHAAAYKHVPLMEDHPDQAIKTNVFGTRIVAEAAREWDAERFVLISTDKAVNPSSIMGASKRAAEVLTKQTGASGNTSFVSVRFGNVLGSRGSVVPIFREQIARGGPVTVTDPEMKRYFMTIPEAVMLVLQAAVIGRNGQVMVLDMGEPVKIVHLARQLISLSGFTPDVDIPITYTGIRPGEKLFEDLLSAEEGTKSTLHDRVFVARVANDMSLGLFEERIQELESATLTGQPEAIVASLQNLVSTYRPQRDFSELQPHVVPIQAN